MGRAVGLFAPASTTLIFRVRSVCDTNVRVPPCPSSAQLCDPSGTRVALPGCLCNIVAKYMCQVGGLGWLYIPLVLPCRNASQRECFEKELRWELELEMVCCGWLVAQASFSFPPALLSSSVQEGDGKPISKSEQKRLKKQAEKVWFDCCLASCHTPFPHPRPPTVATPPHHQRDLLSPRQFGACSALLVPRHFVMRVPCVRCMPLLSPCCGGVHGVLPSFCVCLFCDCTVQEAKAAEKLAAKAAAPAPKKATGAGAGVVDEDLDGTQYFESRCAAIDALEKAGTNPYPHKFEGVLLLFKEFVDRFSYLEPGQKAEEVVRLAGRISFVRHSSSKLQFYTLNSEGDQLQVLLDIKVRDWCASSFAKIGCLTLPLMARTLCVCSFMKTRATMMTWCAFFDVETLSGWRVTLKGRKWASYPSLPSASRCSPPASRCCRT
jgi:hypothetical protein